MDLIENYRKMLAGEIHRMPDGTYSSEENLIILLRHLAFDILNIEAEQARDSIDTYTLKKHKLGTIMNYIDIRLITLISRAFPEASWSDPIDKPRRKRSDPEFLKKENAPELLDYFQEMCNGDIDRLPKLVDKADMDFDRKIHLLNPWEGDFAKAVEYLYPGKFKPWQFHPMPDSYWADKQNRLDAIGWLDKKIGHTLSRGDYVRNNLYNLWLYERRNHGGSP